MTTKEHFELLNKCGVKVDICEIIGKRAQRYLDALFIPNEDGRFHRDPERCKLFGIDEEPINWGDLSVCDVVELKDGSFIVTIEEAAPECHTLCAYIEKYLRINGWEVKVKTEW
jgi:hypothetical protein